MADTQPYTCDHLYSGSRMFQGVATYLERPLDEISFFGCLLITIIVGVPFRIFLGPEKASAQTRHIAQAVIGLTLTFVCNGTYAYIITLQIVTCLVIMKLPSMQIGIRITQSQAAHLVLFVAMAILLYIRGLMYLYDYQSYKWGIFDTLMYTTQRLSGLAYSLADAKMNIPVTNNYKLESRRKQAVHGFPGFIAGLSYAYNFSAIFIGPFVYYKDYEDYIEGRRKPSSFVYPYLQAVFRIIQALTFFYASSFILKSLDAGGHTALPQPGALESMQKAGFSAVLQYIVYRTIVLFFFMLAVRLKYYFVFKFTEAAPITAGLVWTKNRTQDQSDDASSEQNGSSSHYENNNVVKEELKYVECMNTAVLETTTNAKQFLDNWNIPTMAWLHHVVNSRIAHRDLSMIVTCFFSGLWHGFYGGYFLWAAANILFFTVSKYARKTLAVYFKSHVLLRALWTLIAFLSVRLATIFTLLPFWLMTVDKFHVVNADILYYIYISALSIYFVCYVMFTLQKSKPKHE